MIPITSEPLTQKGPTARLDAENFCDVQDVKINPTENGEMAMKQLRELEKEKGRSETEETCGFGGEEGSDGEQCEYTDQQRRKEMVGNRPCMGHCFWFSMMWWCQPHTV